MFYFNLISSLFIRGVLVRAGVLWLETTVEKKQVMNGKIILITNNKIKKKTVNTIVKNHG